MATATRFLRARRTNSDWSGFPPGTPPDDAREFFRGYVAYQSEKVENLGGLPRGEPDSISRNDGEVLYVVECHGCDVIVLEGFAAEPTVALLRSALQAKKIEMKPAVRKHDDGDKNPGAVSAFLH